MSNSTLFWPGCYSHAFLDEKISNYKKILKNLDIKFSLAEKNLCCGGLLINAGYEKESRKIARELFEKLKKQKIKKIITPDPLCYKTFSKDYPAILPDWDIKVEFILITILKNLLEKKSFLKNELPEELKSKILYHDSCYLGRYSQIYDEPREILSFLGYYVTELFYNRKNSLCCGSCGGLKQTNPELADKVAKDFIKQIKRTGIKKIVTADPQAYFHLKKNLEGESIKIFDFSDILCDAFKLKRTLF